MKHSYIIFEIINMNWYVKKWFRKCNSRNVKWNGGFLFYQLLNCSLQLKEMLLLKNTTATNGTTSTDNNNMVIIWIKTGNCS